MKHLIKENLIVQSGLPSSFIRENGEGFWGGYQNRTDLHYVDSWRDEVIPDFNPRRQHLSAPYYNAFHGVVDFQVINNVIDLEAEKQIHFDALAQLRAELISLIMQVKLSSDPEPMEMSSIEPMIRTMYLVGKEEINALTQSNVIEYVLRGAQVNELIGTLNSFL